MRQISNIKGRMCYMLMHRCTILLQGCACISTATPAPYLLCNVVINNNVAYLVQQLRQRGDGRGCSCNIFHATTPHKTIQLPVG